MLGAWFMVRLCYKPHYQSNMYMGVCLGVLANFRIFGASAEGHFLCDYFLQPSGTSD